MSPRKMNPIVISLGLLRDGWTVVVNRGHARCYFQVTDSSVGRLSDLVFGACIHDPDHVRVLPRIVVPGWITTIGAGGGE
jgi:hypothetical protein